MPAMQEQLACSQNTWKGEGQCAQNAPTADHPDAASSIDHCMRGRLVLPLLPP